MSDTVSTPDRQAIRAAFPALQSDIVFFENAGGSQVPARVSDAIHRYMRETYVQLGAGYPLSRKCTQTVDDAHAFARMFMNAGDGHVVLGSSTTALLNMLAASYAQALVPGQKIIIAETGHEANLGPWKRLESRGLDILWWRLDPETCTLPMAGLRDLLDEDTALVALPHVSNLVGTIEDLPAITAAAHAAGARVVCDGVALAPHRAIDVQAWDVDWYVYSTYKVYGPHMAALYGKREAFDGIPGPNHFFIPRDDMPYQFEPGGANHESCAGLLGLGDYLCDLVGSDGPCDRKTVEAAFERMVRWEAPLIERLVGYLDEKPGVKLIGSASTGDDRVATISFVHASKSSAEIAAEVDRTRIAIRNGHMYAWHLCEAIGLDPVDGVVRVSMVHYNTPEEVEDLIAVLDGIL